MKHLYITTLLSIITISTLHAADLEQQLIDLMKRGHKTKFSEDEMRERLNKNDVNILFKGMGFLHWAAGNGAIDIMEMLHGKGAEIDLPNTIKSTPLHTAAFFGQLKAVTFLLEHGADRDKRNLFEETPAEVARDYGNPDIANFIDNWQDLLEIKEPDIE
jgi:hypothetical protein